MPDNGPISGFTNMGSTVPAADDKLVVIDKSDTTDAATGTTKRWEWLDFLRELFATRFGADAGSNDTYVVTLTPAPAAYVTGEHYRFKANTANTGACTVNFNSLGAKTIKKVAGGITTDLADNDIRAGQWVDLVYDGTNMQMQSLLGNAPAAGIGGSTGATDNAILRADGTGGSTVQSSTITIDDTGAITVPEMAAPATPASGKVALYAKSDGLLYSKDDAGTETVVTGGAGGGGSPGGSDGDIQYRVDASTFGGSPLKRLDANTVEQRNSTTTQQLRVMRTYTSSTNHDGVRLGDGGSGDMVVGTFKGSGGGTVQILKVQGSSLSFETGTGSFTGRWEIDSSALQPSSTNNYSIGSDSRNVTQIHVRTGVMFNDGATNAESPKIIRTDASLEVKTLNDGAPTYLFLKDAGRKVTTANFDKTNTTLADVTNLTESVRAGVTYHFEAELFIDADAVGGSKFAIAGTATATAIEYQIILLDNSTNAYTINARQTALAGSTGQAGTTAGYCRIAGTIVVNAAGTLTVQFAQNAATGTSTVRARSTFRIEKF